MTNFFSKINISSVHGSRELSAFPISILPLFFSHWRKLQFWETNYSTCLTSITTPSAFSHSQNSRFGRSKKFSILIFCETKDLYLLITVRYICKKDWQMIIGSLYITPRNHPTCSEIDRPSPKDSKSICILYKSMTGGRNTLLGAHY